MHTYLCVFVGRFGSVAFSHSEYISPRVVENPEELLQPNLPQIFFFSFYSHKVERCPVFFPLSSWTIVLKFHLKFYL